MPSLLKADETRAGGGGKQFIISADSEESWEFYNYQISLVGEECPVAEC